MKVEKERERERECQRFKKKKSICPDSTEEEDRDEAGVAGKRFKNGGMKSNLLLR